MEFEFVKDYGKRKKGDVIDDSTSFNKKKVAQFLGMELIEEKKSLKKPTEKSAESTIKKYLTATGVDFTEEMSQEELFALVK